VIWLPIGAYGLAICCQSSGNCRWALVIANGTNTQTYCGDWCGGRWQLALWFPGVSPASRQCLLSDAAVSADQASSATQPVSMSLSQQHPMNLFTRFSLFRHLMVRRCCFSYPPTVVLLKRVNKDVPFCNLWHRTGRDATHPASRIDSTAKMCIPKGRHNSKTFRDRF